MSNNKSQNVRTTGILQNNLGVAVAAHLELVNLNTSDVEVRVQVLNWGTAVTQTNPVSTLLDVTQTLAGNTRIAFSATIPASFHYEVRLSVNTENRNRNNNNGGNNKADSDNVLLNTYARTAVGAGQVVGLSVLDSQFQTVSIENCF
ncbi:hypothetical protein AN963_09405 [Brevibacillus choshinensis]|uniref:CARDB domain-containing protein n=1 Tax=Brevibacillus choshinensis TaxID=54911 RepID=A0ABR5NEE7_BRECH|nr:hypothetical protein [Brevibacillus choshinensis]KQL49887.1 hypothetical protein AN963_09405 [Brevibacillus choshinensis]